jgi:hypothetical protein
MNIALCILLLRVLLLFFILWQDITYRAVYWFLFPVLLLLEVAAQAFSIIPVDVYVLNIGLNFLMIIIQIGVLYVYFKCIRKIDNLFANAFGLGDLLMLFCFACAFPFAGFILFCLITFLISIILVLLVRLLKKDIAASVPLAGIQAGIYSVLLLINYVYALPIFSLNYWLFNFMNV